MASNPHSDFTTHKPHLANPQQLANFCHMGHCKTGAMFPQLVLLFTEHRRMPWQYRLELIEIR